MKSIVAFLCLSSFAAAQQPSPSSHAATEPEAVLAFLARVAPANPATGPATGRIVGDADFSIFGQPMPFRSKQGVAYRFTTESDWIAVTDSAQGRQLSLTGDRVVVLERLPSEGMPAKRPLTFRRQDTEALLPLEKNRAPIDLMSAPTPANWIQWSREHYALASVEDVRLLGLPKTLVAGKRRNDATRLAPVVRLYFHPGTFVLERIEFNESETSAGARWLQFESGSATSPDGAFAAIPADIDCSQLVVAQLREMLPMPPLSVNSFGWSASSGGTNEPISTELPTGAKMIADRMLLRYAPVAPPPSRTEPCVHLVAGGKPLHPEGHLEAARCADCAAYQWQLAMANSNPGRFQVEPNRCPTGGVHQRVRVPCTHFGTAVAHPSGDPATGPIPKIALLGPYFVGSRIGFSRWLDALDELPGATTESTLIQFLGLMSDVAHDESLSPATAQATMVGYRDVVQEVVERLRAKGVVTARYAEPLQGFVVEAISSLGARVDRSWLQLLQMAGAEHSPVLAERLVPSLLKTSDSKDAVAIIELIDRIQTLPKSVALRLPEIEAAAPSVEARMWASNRLNSRPAQPAAGGSLTAGSVWLGSASNAAKPVRLRLIVRTVTDISFQGEASGDSGRPAQVTGSYDSSDGAVRVFVKKYDADGNRVPGTDGNEVWNLALKNDAMTGTYWDGGRTGTLELTRRQEAATVADVLASLRPGTVISGEGSWKLHKGGGQGPWRIRFTVISREGDRFTARAEFNGVSEDFRGTINSRERSVELLGRVDWSDAKGRRKESAMAVKVKAVGDLLCGSIKWNGSLGGEGPAELRVTEPAR